MLKGYAAVCAGLVAAAQLGCSATGDPRPQLLLFVDTDVVVPGQLGAVDELSGDAVLDTMRVDVVPGPSEPLLFVAPDPSDWPVSFGVAAPEDGGAVLLRIRLFRGAYAGAAAEDGSVEPPRSITDERLVRATFPDDGIRRLQVTLAGDCMGVLPSFLDETSCLDGELPSVDAAEGVTELSSEDVPSTRVGTWVAARPVNCSGSAPHADAVCIPGGLLLLGEPELFGYADQLFLESVPMKPVLVSPFWIDRFEMTVGRFNSIAATSWPAELLPKLPITGDILYEHCTWPGSSPGPSDSLPLNCVSLEAAALACERAGGTLPSEAQWEHAARGHGQRRTYPWPGDRFECCAASVGRKAQLTPEPKCSEEEGPEPVGSHPPSELCAGLGDETIDGVVDLAGGMNEATRDKAYSYDEGCWNYQGVPRDFVCEDPSIKAVIARGSSWNGDPALAQNAFRSRWIPVGAAHGFRCAYPDGGGG